MIYSWTRHAGRELWHVSYGHRARGTSCPEIDLNLAFPRERWRRRLVRSGPTAAAAPSTEKYTHRQFTRDDVWMTTTLETIIFRCGIWVITPKQPRFCFPPLHPLGTMLFACGSCQLFFPSIRVADWKANPGWTTNKSQSSMISLYQTNSNIPVPNINIFKKSK